MKKLFCIFAIVVLTLTSCQQLDFNEDFQTTTSKSTANKKFNVS